MPFRVLFVNEGALGVGVVGHPRVEHALEEHLHDHYDVDARFLRLPPMSLPTRLAVRGVPLLADVDLDAQRTRWHLAQSVRARSVVRAALRAGPVDALHVNSHTIALTMASVMRQVPTYVSVDATIRSWEHLEVWRRARPWTDAMLTPSYVLERRAFERSAGVTAWTAWSAADVRTALPAAAVHVVHPGLDLDVFRPATRRPRERPRILFVGGRFEEKGGQSLIDALGPRIGIDVDLDVVTTAAVLERAGMTVHRLEAASDTLVELFQQADLFCLPTRADAAPFAVTEALACGTPVVSTRVGAIPELVGHGQAGTLVPPGDVRALRAAIDELLADPSRRAAMGAAGRARCVRHYDSRLQSERLIEVMRGAR